MTRETSPEDLPPNVTAVYEQLSTNAPMTQTDLIEATNLPFRPVRDAVEELKKRDVVEELVYSHGHLKLYLFDRKLEESETGERAKAL